MCMFSTPKMPAPPPQRQTARAPEEAQTGERDTDLRRRRLAMASSIFTSGLGAPAVSGNQPLGA